jgi:hypothetical protein
MTDGPEDKKEAIIDMTIEALQKVLKRISLSIEDTMAFLKRCGVTHIKELAAGEMRELRARIMGISISDALEVVSKTGDLHDKKDAMIDGALARLNTELQGLSDKLGDLNSMYPATKAFLLRCGVTHIKELTPEQMTELTTYLTAERDAILAQDSSN